MIAPILAVAGVAVSLLVYSPDKPRAELEAAYPGAYSTVDGVRLRLRDTGPRNAPVVIMLHGFASSLDTWEPWAQQLSARYRVIRFDLPGFGLTGPDPTGDYSDDREIKILADLMNKLGIARASLIGNSLGGRIAWNFAAQHPNRVNRMVLISPDGFASAGFEYDKTPETPLVMRALPYVTPRPLLRETLAAAYARPEALSDETVTRYHDLMLAPGVREAILARMEQVRLRDPAPTLARIKIPTLLVWGEKDAMIPISNADDFLRDLPHAKLVRLPDLGHVPFEENPAASLAPVEDFLAGKTS
ncbi:pimeloyl-ACP methyl ester carboxylesterase [Rhodoblastus acidophilus]|uniref:alpha/beta fold hydrolase n=1 Tax=Rhodoblastus acidophilus TaxID=1074 RepID=UPI0022248A5D|nr:alpha/beta hydrolase [Rhodoblastus acidophilus]MCW2285171.1 pimeloyl-ACP methyl ester carboxylesterase [Rhodoblastus acidophilus]MCW2334127.1 pimeloyl-ACP methyl ester carboxylesterase [Rhodoblastus acidophilus]